MHGIIHVSHVSLSVSGWRAGGLSVVCAMLRLQSSSNSAHVALLSACWRCVACISAQSLRYLHLRLALSFHVTSLRFCIMLAMVICSSDIYRAVCVVMCLALLDIVPSFLTTLLSGSMADATCLNAVQSSGFAFLPLFHALTALSAARMILLQGQLASGGSDCGTRARMFWMCVVRFVRYSCVVSSSSALHFPDITCCASGTPLHPCAIHPCAFSRVAAPVGFLSAAAHFSMLHPSMPGKIRGYFYSDQGLRLGATVPQITGKPWTEVT